MQATVFNRLGPGCTRQVKQNSDNLTTCAQPQQFCRTAVCLLLCIHAPCTRCDLQFHQRRKEQTPSDRYRCLPALCSFEPTRPALSIWPCYVNSLTVFGLSCYLASRIWLALETHILGDLLQDAARTQCADDDVMHCRCQFWLTINSVTIHRCRVARHRPYEFTAPQQNIALGKSRPLQGVTDHRPAAVHGLKHSYKRD